MYKILAFENGQPVILYHDRKNVYMYTASGGRILSRGVLFNDVKTGFEVFSGEKDYVYYISTDNRIKLASLNRDRFVEYLSIPMEDEENNCQIVNVSPLMCENELYIFYCNHNHSENNYEVYYIVSSTPNKSCLIERNISDIESFDVFSSNKKVYIVLDDNCYYLSSDKKLVTVKAQTHSEPETDSLKSNIEKLKETLSDKSQKLMDMQKQLYDKNNEISNLKATQKHITEQYNELAEYAGKLQEELRKFRYMPN